MAADLDRPDASERPPASPSPRGRRRNTTVDPKQVRLAALLLFGAIIAGMVMFAAIADPGEPKEPGTTQSIIPEPNSGRKPESLGDPGGWGQLTLLALVIVAVSGIGYVAIRGRSASARAGREAWLAAGESGHDGALEELLEGDETDGSSADGADVSRSTGESESDASRS